MKYPRLQRMTLEELLSNPNMLPRQDYNTIINNGGGVFNHRFFFNNLAPAGENVHKPERTLLSILNRTYGSFDNFKEEFMKNALNVFGSGWTALTITPQGRPAIINLRNQNTVLSANNQLVMQADVWEHAYYLKYKNERKTYLENIWNVITFTRL